MNFLRSIIAGIALALLTSGAALAQCGTQAPANKFCGNDTGSQALATWKSVPTGALSAISGGTVLGNRGAVAAVPSPLTNPVLGIPGASTGEVGLAGITSGTAVLRAQAVAGSAVSLLPTSAGTLVSTASSPLAVNATTGLMTCPTCVTSSGGGAITGTAPIAVSAAGVVSINAPYVTLTASNGGIVYSGATNLAILAGTATARQMLQSGASTTPAWSTATWPATTAAGTMLASSSASTVVATATPVLGVAGTTVGSLGFQNLTSGTVTLQPVTGALGTVTINIPAAAGTLAVSATAPITLSAAGAVGITGAALTKTDDTNVTMTLGGTPASALVTAASLTLGWTGQLAVGRGGTGLSAGTTGGIPYFSSTSAMAVLAAGSATQVLHGGASAPVFGAVVSADMNITTTSCTNQFVSAISSTAVGTCSTVAVGQIGSLGTGVATALTTALSGAGGVTSTISSGTLAMGVSAISSGTCASVITAAATNATTTDVVTASFNSDPTAVTGYIPSVGGMLTIIVYPTAGNVNFKVCNNTAASVTPGAVTLNWRVVR